MADPITLPPLPEPVYTYDEDGNKVFYEKASLVRARDLEVARIVLEAAAMSCERYAKNRLDDEAPIAYVYGAKDCATSIRALEVRHHE